MAEIWLQLRSGLIVLTEAEESVSDPARSFSNELPRMRIGSCFELRPILWKKTLSLL